AVCRTAGATAKLLLPYDVSVVLPEQIAEGDLSPVRFCSFESISASKAKGRLRGPMFSAGPNV
ncbi:hypothetical protein SB748_32870, partial [Rhizobium sp. SIMBA_035]